MDHPVIEAQNLTKQYGNFTAVKDLNLIVSAGEVFGLLGPNGAGKTTTILMLLGLTEPTRGQVRVLGLDPTRYPLSVKARVGYLPDQVGFYDDLTARENLSYIARLNGLSGKELNLRVEEALEHVHLRRVADQRVGTFSRGMRQRLGLADVLLKRPQLIIMDEPTQGLDPELAREFLGLIHSLKQEGITILLSSHLLHQVQEVCDRVGLFHRGQMVLEGTVPDLAQKVLGGAYVIGVHAEGSPEELQNALRMVSQVRAVHSVASDRYQVEAQSDVRAEIAQAVVQAGGRLFGLTIQHQNLEEIYRRYFEEAKDAQAA